jgi:hypothetical protein
LEDTIREAYSTVDEIYGLEQAEVWAEGFEFPPDTCNKDLADFVACGYDIRLLLKTRQDALRPDRINHDRIDAWDQTDPDLARLRGLADHIEVPLDPHFVPCMASPPFAKGYRAAPHAMNKIWYNLQQAGFLLLLPTKALSQGDRGPSESGWASQSPCNLAPKYKKRQGRQTSNYRYTNKLGGQINTPFVKEAVKELYGEIYLPTLSEIILMILAEADVQGGFEHLSLFKMDLLGAFNLLFFDPAKAAVFTHQLTNDLSVVTLVGNFGWCGTPFAFNVCSRAILRRCRQYMARLPSPIGRVTMYVDDVIGVCHVTLVPECIECTTQAITELVGPEAKTVAKDKTEHGRVLDAIGWRLDLDLQLVSLARHNYLKTLYGFLILNEGSHVALEFLEKLASWSSRYSLVCRFMRPFSRFLYHSTVGRRTSVRILLTGNLWVVITMWRMFLAMMAIDPKGYTRTFASFRPAPCSVFANVDASLTGIGAIISRCSSVVQSGSPLSSVLQDPDSLLAFEPPNAPRSILDEDLIAVFGHRVPYLTRSDSQYQNSMEFICAVMVLGLLVSLGHRDISVMLEGDSTTSLAWCVLEKFRGSNSLAASVAYIILSKASGIVFTEAIHISGDQMKTRSDPLSRGMTPESCGYSPRVVKTLANNPTLELLLLVMDPTRVLDLSSDLGTVWTEMEHISTILMSYTGGWQED